ncbi:crotonase/enoyl-CoA hydratase family protein [Aeromicrobium duanguangcaii]|uniref:Crotonase/enoyl-CoA hydratase family protein n=1 Tax=Aeromicrobium duanguangcaii TaxID=2968086 RepID=A0ABY5KFE6_9ACTN|nr:crotonase/enoyl-CoA hydratase family protein [Aeromicrobium duanguangcaii]MCD9153907.1 crotonase/enoyl-CoA hydratase family protein [Aeromicrobium duanguangcaii]UUI69014.1 crotonase/enoyl-CoA hydratase family protein [Aeromicrobium duanguangcaii]
MSVVLAEKVLDGRALLITLNRPDARNAVNGQVAREMAAILDDLDADHALVVGIIRGEGRGFSAGMDLKAFLEGDFPEFEDRGFGGFAQRGPKTPLIAAIEGFAVAGGLEMALACDLIVAASDAKLGLPEVKRSLIAAGGGLLRLAQRIPYHVAAEIALTGDHVPVERLYQVGLINRIAEPGQALDEALALASRIVDNAPLALEGSKHVLENAADWGLAEGWRHQEPVRDRVSHSEDAREGATAFAERRAPVWRGR